ncbi:hypothetical protein IJG22_00890 [Candidatus Saccharibacteria bacterium]|nr:hypothetical protein [Candidatus Saccharibacteria bacterium]
MDNSNDYNQQFIQSVKASVQSQPIPPQKTTSSRTQNSSIIYTAIIIALVIVILVESITIAVLINNLFYGEGDDGYIDNTETAAEDLSHGNYIYGSDGKLVALNAKCINNNDGSSYEFTTEGDYHYNNSGALPSSGIYTIQNDSLISLQSSLSGDKVLYYDGLNLADGLTIYVCD